MLQTIGMVMYDMWEWPGTIITAQLTDDAGSSQRPYEWVVTWSLMLYLSDEIPSGSNHLCPEDDDHQYPPSDTVDSRREWKYTKTVPKISQTECQLYWFSSSMEDYRRIGMMDG